MMKIAVYNMKGMEKGSITLGRRLSGPVRQDLIKRAVAAELAARRQPYGTDPEAGKRTSAKYRGRRGVRHSMMNREMARMKRITSTRSLYMRARFVPQAVKGRKAHPPKAEKIWERKINKKERTAALFSAAVATLDRGWIEKRGYDLEYIKKIPVVVEDKLEEVKTIRDVKQILDNFGLIEELEWLGEKKIRSGKGTMRGRRYKRKRGMLIVVENDKGIARATRNLAGLEVCEVANLGVDMLAPGAEPGRLCIWTEGALKKMEGLS
jgi:large subunit ribosomal protein L4e